jgi:hypothetical protein
MIELLSRVIGFAVLAAIGYLLAPSVRRPQAPGEWLLWLAALVLAGYIGVDARLVGLFSGGLYVKAMLQGLIFGLLAGFVLARPGTQR